jgi:poly-gamma-glutamate synthesis protein (capsule biosynthesis protein)
MLPYRLSFALLLASSPSVAAACDIQFFGDTFITDRVIEATASVEGDARFLAGVEPLLSTCAHNVVNFEGVATTAPLPLEPKRHLLRMPIGTAALLRSGGVDVATLANNHTMDFGWSGLFESLDALANAGIAVVGAGRDVEEASAPLLLGTSTRPVCLLSFSRTLPPSFWAKPERPGTAFADAAVVASRVKACATNGYYTIAAFHWGTEGSAEPHAYQRALGRLAIDSGASLVVGHHPHVLQSLEIHAGKPIFFSIGNFSFGTVPRGGGQEGVALRVALSADGGASIRVVPLAVSNSTVQFKPRPLTLAEADSFKRLLPPKHPCRPVDGQRAWDCAFLP